MSFSTEAPVSAPRPIAVRGVLLVSCTYVYFLLFAQYGLVRLAQARFGMGAVDSMASGLAGAPALSSSTTVQIAMACMGIAGLVASLLTARALASERARALVRSAFLAAAACAFLAPTARQAFSFYLVAAGTGASLGVLTVALASRLPRWMAGRSVGLQVGLGTGTAYLLCNVPALFEGAPELQAAFVGGVALLGALATVGGRDQGFVGSSAEAAGWPFRRIRPADAMGWGFVAVVLGFLALVWLDSAAFNIIQETAALKGFTWESPQHKLSMGGAHFLGAVLAGWLLDRGVLRGLMLGAYVLFVVSFVALQAGAAPAWAGPLYAVGISIYSTALVAYPSFHGMAPGMVQRRWRAAAVYGVGGWLGSALGVGMAQDLHRIPVAFLVAAGLLLVVPVLVNGRRLGLQRLGRSPAARSLALAWVVVAAFAVSTRGDTDAETARAPVGPDPVALGRAVYVSEGCINCHSQFLRPRVAHDLEWWGPHRPLDRAEHPPLVGNRRQGPDLLNAGNRRSEAWHRQHLVDPSSVSPGSRMPSYAHLFEQPVVPRYRGTADEEHDALSRGEALVAYLASLGHDSATSRYLDAQLVPVSGLENGNALRGAATFATYCARCHGPTGAGDGPVGDAVSGDARNLGKGDFWLPTWGEQEGTLEEGLARLIRFGVTGTDMPGHEWLRPREIADLVAFVQTLPGTHPEPERAPSVDWLEEEPAWLEPAEDESARSQAESEVRRTGDAR